jgi:hypothetical protein
LEAYHFKKENAAREPNRNKKGPSHSTLGLLAVRGSHNPLLANLPVGYPKIFLFFFSCKPCAACMDYSAQLNQAEWHRANVLNSLALQIPNKK